MKYFLKQYKNSFNERILCKGVDNPSGWGSSVENTIKKINEDWLLKKEELEKLKWKTPEELKEAYEKLQKTLSEEVKKGLLQFIEELKNKKTPESTNVSEQTETVNGWYSIDKLEEDIDASEVLKEFTWAVEAYVDMKLNFKWNTNYTESEKNNIRLVLLEEAEKNFDLTAIAFWTPASEYMWKTQEIMDKNPELMKKLKTKNQENNTMVLMNFFDKIKESANNFDSGANKIKSWDEYAVFDIIIWKSIENIQKEKEADKKFDSLKSVLDITSLIVPDKTWKYYWDYNNLKDDAQIYTKIKSNVQDFWKKIWTWRNIWDSFKNMISWLPEEAQWFITDFLKDLSENPFIKFLLSLIFWKEFLSWDWENIKQSIQNLASFSKNENFPIKWLKNNEELWKIEAKDLKDFSEYIKSKWLNQSKEWFWEYFLAWKEISNSKLEKTDKEKIEEIRKLFPEFSEIKNVWDFKTFLNELPKKENNNKIKELEKWRLKSQKIIDSAKKSEKEVNEISKNIEETWKEIKDKKAKIKKTWEKIEEAKAEIENLKTQKETVSEDKKAEIDAEIERKKAEKEAEEKRQKEAEELLKQQEIELKKQEAERIKKQKEAELKKKEAEKEAELNRVKDVEVALYKAEGFPIKIKYSDWKTEEIKFKDWKIEIWDKKIWITKIVWVNKDWKETDNTKEVSLKDIKIKNWYLTFNLELNKSESKNPLNWMFDSFKQLAVGEEKLNPKFPIKRFLPTILELMKNWKSTYETEKWKDWGYTKLDLS